jgi:hypothetical protein
MNRLSREKRAQILELSEAGHTVREICKEVGVSRETVTSLSIGTYRRRLFKMSERIFEELEKAGMDPLSNYPANRIPMWAQAFLDLHQELGWKCPVHPEADPDKEDVWAGSACRLCVADGLKRHHERRKAEGRPIVPPWRREKGTDLGETSHPEPNAISEVTSAQEAALPVNETPEPVPEAAPVVTDPETVDWVRVSEVTHRRLHMNQDWIEFSHSQEVANV